jgi:curved DNA-binding protein
VLGVPPTSNAQEIKAAYLKLVKKYHPDHNSDPGAEEAFKELGKAYETLKDPIKRQIYDLAQGTNARDFDYDQAGQGFSAHRESQDTGYYQRKQGQRKYYDNRWYEYRRPQYETLNEDYQEK